MGTMVKIALTAALVQVVTSDHWPADVPSGVKPPAHVQNNRASESNIKAMGLSYQIQQYCMQEMGCNDLYQQGWSIQGEPDWHDQPLPNDDPPYAMYDNAVFSNTRHPEVAAHSGACADCDNTQGESALTCGNDLSWSFQQTSSATATKGASSATSLEFELDLPFTKDSLTETVTITSEHSTSTSKSHTVTYSPTAGTTVQPGHHACIQLTGTETDMTSDWTMNVHLQGKILCRFNSKCQGHYLWYVGLSGITDQVQGTVASTTVANTAAKNMVGPCPTTLCTGLWQNATALPAAVV